MTESTMAEAHKRRRFSSDEKAKILKRHLSDRVPISDLCDTAYLNISSTFYYLCTVLDRYSRAVVHWEIREQMCESDVQTIVQRGREKYPEAKPRLISDNGPQFIAREVSCR